MIPATLSKSIFSVIFLVLMFSSWLAMKIMLLGSSFQPYFCTQCFRVLSEEQKHNIYYTHILKTLLGIKASSNAQDLCVLPRKGGVLLQN